MKYRPEIDGLRAVAVLPVIFFHAGFEWFSGGFVGVDVFFVISGYLITTIIISEISERRFTLLNFYERRARRILPALFFVSLVCLPFAWSWLAPRDLRDFGQSLVAVSTFSSNVLFWLESGYFDSTSELKPLLHTWSLAVEEQYYVLFPLLMMLTWRKSLKWTLVALSALFVISLALAQSWSISSPSAAFYLLPTRIWELMIGGFAAVYLHRNAYPKSLLVNQLMSVLGLAMIIYAILAFSERTPFPGAYALVPTIGTCLLVLFAVPGTLVQKLLNLRPIVAIGLFSYSAYLWHQPLLAFAHHRFMEQPPSVLLLVLCFASLLLAYATWRWIEAPFRNRDSVSRTSIFVFSVVGLVFFGSIGVILHLKHGFPERLDNQLELRTASSSPLRQECHSQQTPCEYFGDSVTWATLGDSHAVELTYALADALKDQNVGVQHNSYTECAPNSGGDADGCQAWTRSVVERLVSDPAIENVVITYRLTLHLYGESLGAYPALVDEKSEGDRSKIWQNLLDIVNAFVAAGKTVYFVVQPPELPAFIEKSILWHGAAKERVRGVDRAWWESRNAYVFSRLGEMPDSARLIDPTNIFCDSSHCYSSDAEGYLYFDDDHLSVYGARKVVEMIVSSKADL